MINSRDIKDLHPTVRRAAEELKKRMEAKGYKLSISSTLRDNEYQNELYAKGRTAPGSIVTKVKGGGSMHNYKLAFDIFQNLKGKEYDKTFMDTAGKIGTELGLEWGGSWTGFVDTPHFQWTDGLKLSDLQAGKVPADKKLKWEA